MNHFDHRHVCRVAILKQQIANDKAEYDEAMSQAQSSVAALQDGNAELSNELQSSKHAVSP